MYVHFLDTNHIKPGLKYNCRGNGLMTVVYGKVTRRIML